MWLDLVARIYVYIMWTSNEDISLQIVQILSVRGRGREWGVVAISDGEGVEIRV